MILSLSLRILQFHNLTHDVMIFLDAALSRNRFYYITKSSLIVYDILKLNFDIKIKRYRKI